MKQGASHNLNSTKSSPLAFVSVVTVLLCLAAVTTVLFFAAFHRHQLNVSLINAIKQSNTNEVIALLDRGADANSVDNSIHKLTLVEYFKSSWSKIEDKTQRDSINKYYPALWVSYEDPNMADLRYPSAGRPSEENSDIIAALLNHGANPNLKDVNGKTLLYVAAYYGRSKTVKLLLDAGADPNICDNFGRSPLMVADFMLANRLDQTERAEDPEHSCSALLLKSRADVNAQDHNGRTPIMYRSSEHWMYFLLQHGANINAQDYSGQTMLIQATKSGHDWIVSYLISIKARVSIRDVKGKSALDYATFDHDLMLLKLLKSGL